MSQTIEWDPEIDAPATIAVIGCGPVALEAALYARFLGYGVFVYEQGRIASKLSKTPERLMGRGTDHTSGELCSSLGLAALDAQESPCNLDDTRDVSSQEYLEHYLLPLARTDLLRDSIGVQSKVCSISRTCSDASLDQDLTTKSELEFRVLISSRKRGEYVQIADIILDCSGLATQQGLASGGGLAVGEQDLLPNENGYWPEFGETCQNSLSPTDHVMIWGDNQAACSAVLQLAAMIEKEQIEKVTWIRPKRLSNSKLKFRGVPEAEREACEQLAAELQPKLVQLDAWGIESLKLVDTSWKVVCQTTDEETLDLHCTAFINFSDQQRDWSFWPGTPPKPVDYEDSSESAPENVPKNALRSVFTTEPHYYLLGEKSQRNLSLHQAREQIKNLFSIIGGRRELDLYSSIQPKS